MTIAIFPLFVNQGFADFHDTGSGITLDISTDKEAYNPGETITISGQVNPQMPNTDVILQIISPQATNIIQVEQLEVDSDGNFTGSIETDFGGAWKNSGTYEIRAFYWNDVRVDIQFDYGMTSVGTMQEKPLNEEDESVQTEESTEIVGVEERGDMSLDIQGVNVNYTINGGKIISIIPDLDETSLIITIETTTDGELIITLPKDVIDGIFFVLVDGEETIYTEEVSDNFSTLIIPFYNGTEEIEIIGTFVIPEFGTIVVLVLAIAIITIITITSKSRLSIVSKF
ncbi:MAG TPA: PEFG-CTERM sorting domain-containing protein [Candidatus Nitrosopelagicus sp.]|nr:PEFG-CTERM sorting domain-containing protein [Candidatus Nitrosopelagicus sp.]